MRLIVEQVMSMNVAAVPKETAYATMAALLIERGIDAVPVIDDQGTVVGVVSEADLLCRRAFREHYRGPRHRGHPETCLWHAPCGQSGTPVKAKVTAAELMSAPAIVITPDSPAVLAAHTMSWQGVKRLPVIDDDGALVGIVSSGDLLKAFVRAEAETAAGARPGPREDRRRRLLDQAAAATSEVAGLAEVLRMLTRVIVPAMLDGCGIYLLPEFDGPPTLPFVAERLISMVGEGTAPQPGLERFSTHCAFVEAIIERRPIRRVFPPGQPPPGTAPPGAEEWFAAGGANSAALIPVIVGDRVVAVLVAVTCGSREPISACDVDLLARMVDHTHGNLKNALRFQQTERVALALQHYLLPDPPEVAGLEITARYRPSTTTAAIGGDWYDSFRLQDGSTALTVGDVAGHDLDAAVMMSQLRSMLRGLAMEHRESPGESLRRLDIATESLWDEGMATCVLARLEGDDNGTWRLNYSIAGHPPPLLVTHEGGGRYLEDAANPALGVGYDLARTSAVTELRPGSTLLFYTDGLVEIPGEHLDDGLERLRREAESLAHTPLNVFADRLLSLAPASTRDDIAMIAVRLTEHRHAR